MTGSDDERYVHHLEIVRVVPCLADPNKIRFSSEFDRDVAEIFPYLNAILQGAIYNHLGKSLTLHKDGRLITLYPRRMEAAKINNFDDARDIVAWIVETINDCHARRGDIEPDIQRRNRLSVLDIVKILPGSNCKKCGYLTCLAFAAALCEEKLTILACADIFLAEYADKRQQLLTLLQAGGYFVPSAFYQDPGVKAETRKKKEG
jgi:ArsR family metal-binding transcriptional regulator